MLIRKEIQSSDKDRDEIGSLLGRSGVISAKGEDILCYAACVFINTSSADEAIIAYAAARHVLAGTGVQDVGTSSSAIESTPEPPLTTSLPVVPVTVTSAISCTVTVNTESTGLPN